MSELHSGTETAEPLGSSARDAGDKSQHGEASLSARDETSPGALAMEDRLPARQDSRAAAWDDDSEYDEADSGAEYDGDLDALATGDQLPARQDSRGAAWDDAEYDEADLEAEYDGDLEALTTEDRIPAQEGSRAATWDGSPEHDEVGPGGEHDGDLEVLAAEDDVLDTREDHAQGSGMGYQDQDQAVLGEAPSAPGEQDGPPAEALGQATRPDDGKAVPDAAPEAALKELKAEYEASLKELKAELQALKDSRQVAPDAPGSTARYADQARADGLPVHQDNVEVAEHQDDRPGPWSNAKYALYGAVGTTVGMALLDQFAPGVSRVAEDIVAGGPTVIGALVPTLREGWKRKHDNSPDKR